MITSLPCCSDAERVLNDTLWKIMEECDTSYKWIERVRIKFFWQVVERRPLIDEADQSVSRLLYWYKHFCNVTFWCSWHINRGVCPLDSFAELSSQWEWSFSPTNPTQIHHIDSANRAVYTRTTKAANLLQRFWHLQLQIFSLVCFGLSIWVMTEPLP